MFVVESSIFPTVRDRTGEACPFRAFRRRTSRSSITGKPRPNTGLQAERRCGSDTSSSMGRSASASSTLPPSPSSEYIYQCRRDRTAQWMTRFGHPALECGANGWFDTFAHVSAQSIESLSARVPPDEKTLRSTRLQRSGSLIVVQAYTTDRNNPEGNASFTPRAMKPALMEMGRGDGGSLPPSAVELAPRGNSRSCPGPFQTPSAHAGFYMRIPTEDLSPVSERACRKAQRAPGISKWMFGSLAGFSASSLPEWI